MQVAEPADTVNKIRTSSCLRKAIMLDHSSIHTAVPTARSTDPANPKMPLRGADPWAGLKVRQIWGERTISAASHGGR
jgi:hypothetical protein